MLFDTSLRQAVPDHVDVFLGDEEALHVVVRSLAEVGLELQQFVDARPSFVGSAQLPQDRCPEHRLQDDAGSPNQLGIFPRVLILSTSEALDKVDVEIPTRELRVQLLGPFDQFLIRL